MKNLEQDAMMPRRPDSVEIIQSSYGVSLMSRTAHIKDLWCIQKYVFPDSPGATGCQFCAEMRISFESAK